jgi:hypothetical protein
MGCGVVKGFRPVKAFGSKEDAFSRPFRLYKGYLRAHVFFSFHAAFFKGEKKDLACFYKIVLFINIVPTAASKCLFRLSDSLIGRFF